MTEKSSKKVEKMNNLFKSCWGCSGDLSGGIVPMAQKVDPTQNLIFFRPIVIERYGYQSIRTDLIKLSRLVLSRFDEKKTKMFSQNR